MSENITEWLAKELQKREWSMRELARRTGVSHTTIADVMGYRQPPTEKFCVQIALGLNEPVENVLKIAGFVPGSPEEVEDPTLKKWWNFGNELTPAQREEAIQYAIWRFREDRPRPLESEGEREERPGASPSPATSS